MEKNIKKRDVESLIDKETPNLHNVLDPQDVEDFKKLKHELRDTWEKKQVFRTETEMEFSVLNDARHPTNASKYWQCVREQNVFLENLMTLSFDYRNEIVKLKKLYIKLDAEKDELEKEDIQVHIDRLIFNMASSELVAKDRMREIRSWSKFKKQFDDGSFDNRDVNEHQLQTYSKVLKNRKDTLTGNETQPEVMNVLGQVQSLEKIERDGSVIGHTKKESLPGSGETRTKLQSPEK